MMLQWFARTWAVELLLELLSMDTLGQDLGPFGWLLLIVMAPSLPCLTAVMQDAVNPTVLTIWMLE